MSKIWIPPPSGLYVKNFRSYSWTLICLHVCLQRYCSHLIFIKLFLRNGLRKMPSKGITAKMQPIPSIKKTNLLFRSPYGQSVLVFCCKQKSYLYHLAAWWFIAKSWVKISLRTAKPIPPMYQKSNLLVYCLCNH